MKKIRSILSVALLAATFFVTSCATSDGMSGGAVGQSLSSTSLGSGSSYAATLGDFDPQILPQVMSLFYSFKKLKPRNLQKIYLIPRTNKVEIHFRDNINSLCIILPEPSRRAIISAADQFEKDVEAGTIRDEKATDKNAYATMKCDFWWGVASPSTGAENTRMLANTKIVDGKAYFVLRIPSAEGRTESKKSAFSPYTELYFSPAQLRELCEILDQEYLEEVVQALQQKADAYYY